MAVVDDDMIYFMNKPAEVTALPGGKYEPNLRVVGVQMQTMQQSSVVSHGLLYHHASGN